MGEKKKKKGNRHFYLWAWYPPWHRFTKAYRCLRAYSYCNRREKMSHTLHNTTNDADDRGHRNPECLYLLLVPVETVFLVVIDGCFVTFILCEIFTSIQIILHFLFLLHHMLHDLTHRVTKQLPHLRKQAQNPL